MTEMRPRHYAERIMACRARKDRRAELERVPEHLRAMVRTHVEIQFARMKDAK